MKKVIVATAAVVALAAVAYVMAPDTRAQGRGPDVTTLVGPGSSIGVSIRDLTADESAKAKLLQVGGVMIERVQEGTPAARAGFKDGDVVVDFDGETIRSARQFIRLVRETPPGRTVKATVVRDGSRQTLSVAPEARGRVDLDAFPRISRDLERRFERLPRDFAFDFDLDFDDSRFRGSIVSPRRLGTTLTPLTDQLAGYFGAKEGVLVSSVETDSPAARAGLKAGDVITAVNGRTVTDPSDVRDALRTAEAGGTVEIRVMRDRKELTLKAEMPERTRPARLGRVRI